MPYHTTPDVLKQNCVLVQLNVGARMLILRVLCLMHFNKALEVGGDLQAQNLHSMREVRGIEWVSWRFSQLVAIKVQYSAHLLAED